MKTTTLSFTVEIEDSFNPLILHEALFQGLLRCGVEVLESDVNNVSEKENKQWECASF